MVIYNFYRHNSHPSIAICIVITNVKWLIMTLANWNTFFCPLMTVDTIMKVATIIFFHFPEKIDTHNKQKYPNMKVSTMGTSHTTRPETIKDMIKARTGE